MTMTPTGPGKGCDKGSPPHELKLPDFYWETTRVMTNQTRGKAGGEDGVVADFAQALSPDQKCRLADLIHRLLCGSAPAPAGWKHARVTLIPTNSGSPQSHADPCHHGPPLHPHVVDAGLAGNCRAISAFAPTISSQCSARSTSRRSTRWG